MRKLGMLITLLALVIMSVAFAANYNVQYYYGNTYQPERSTGFGLGLYYGSIKVDNGAVSDTYSGIGARLRYDANNYRFFLDYFSGKDGNDLKEFQGGIGYVFYKSDAYRLVGDLIYRNIDSNGSIHGLGLKVSFGSPVTEDQPFGYRLALIWFPSYSGDIQDGKSFGWEVGLGFRLAESFNGFLSYSGERFNDSLGGDFNYNTFKLGFCYRF